MRFFGTASGAEFTVAEDAGHISRTLRLAPGDVFTGVDGSGTDYDCKITAVGKETVTAKITGSRPCEAEPAVCVTLYQAYVKQGMDVILQKCTELGISAFVPFLSERCVKRPERAADKLQKIARGAVKQCGRSRDVAVCEPITMDELVSRVASHGRAVLCYEEQDTSCGFAAAAGDSADVAVIIGPEGGFTPEEAARLIAAGAQPASLGRRILKADTAGAVAVTLLMHIHWEI